MSGLERCSFVIIALLLLCDKSSAAPNFEACGKIPSNSIDIPGGETVLQLHARGTRNYTCSQPGGAAGVGDNQGEGLSDFIFEADANEIVGFSYYAPGGKVIFVLDYPPESLFGWAEMNRSLADSLGTSPIFQPSPRNDSIPWARWRASSSGGTGILENVTYVARSDTEGGVKPEKCPPGKKSAEVPFTANYAFYTCVQPSSGSLSSSPRYISCAIWLTTAASILLFFP